YLVHEQYFQGWSRSARIHLRSTTKSFISALVGTAIKDGYLTGVDQTLAEVLPSYYLPGLDSIKASVTIEQLLTMTAGFQWDENGTVQADWEASDDWFAFILDLELETDPGSAFKYNSGLPHLLSGIVTNATHMHLQDFAKESLFEPLGIPEFSWEQAPEGINIGGFGLYLAPRDMARFGQLYLDDGMADGVQVLPVGWVAESTRRHSGGTQGYGYLWWIKELGAYSGYAAEGSSGQMIYVFPEIDLLVIFTATIDDSFESVLDAILTTYLLKSIE
ncbi:MAG: serine hydrolase, partial [Candidatus Marinimicrobia bacterium]|nr:serine hydrolase [Candidatus Neomarinimicrobiota bacterium]